jgi:hypothetical protein
MASEWVPSEPEANVAFGKWLQMAGTVGQLISILHVPGYNKVSVITGLLITLSDAQNDQAALLRSIKADTAALRAGPLREALRSIGDAKYAVEGKRPIPVKPRFSRKVAERAEGGFIMLTGGLPGMIAVATVIGVERRACNNLKEFIGFYNLIQRTAIAVSGGSKPQYLALDGPKMIPRGRVIRARDTETFTEPEFTWRLV